MEPQEKLLRKAHFVLDNGKGDTLTIELKDLCECAGANLYVVDVLSEKEGLIDTYPYDELDAAEKAFDRAVVAMGGTNKVNTNTLLN
jgi:hypothetical protein